MSIVAADRGSAGPLADWRLAERIAWLIASRDIPRVTADDVKRLRTELNATVAQADRLAREVTGLGASLSPARARVIGRREWLRSNLASVAWLADPLAEQLMNRSDVSRVLARKAVAVQLGVVFGYLATKVLGQYEVFRPHDVVPGRLTLVGPNLVQLEREFLPGMDLSADEFRLGVSLHEIAHRLQFEAVDWLRPTLRGILDEYLSDARLDAERVRETMLRLGELLRSAGRGQLEPQRFVDALLTPAQQRLIRRAQALMSLLEGHGNVVMDWGAQLLAELGGPDLEPARVRQALNRRRNNSVDRALRRALGLSSKAQQYAWGERFVQVVEQRHGRAAFNRVWEHPAHIPTGDELENPDAWVARVMG